MQCYDIDGTVTRICTHENATIIAARSSLLYGEGGAREVSLFERAVNAMRSIIASVRG
jgi:hypothetical protein